MKAASWCVGAMLAVLATVARGGDESRPATGGPVDASIVKHGEIVPPRTALPCRPGCCPFAGQTVTVMVGENIAIMVPLQELKDEFEAATGASLNVVQMRSGELFENFLSDLINRVGKYDASTAGAWWLQAVARSNSIFMQRQGAGRWRTSTAGLGPTPSTARS